MYMYVFISKYIYINICLYMPLLFNYLCIVFMYYIFMHIYLPICRYIQIKPYLHIFAKIVQVNIETAIFIYCLFVYCMSFLSC